MVECRCPSCQEKFDAVVALTFHIRAEHPGLVEASRELLSRLGRQERLEAKADRESEAQAKVNRFYKLGCPCHHSFAWHEEQRRAPEAGA
jgi:hypothetical protein